MRDPAIGPLAPELLQPLPREPVQVVRGAPAPSLRRQVWRRLLRNPRAVVAMAVLAQRAVRCWLGPPPPSHAEIGRVLAVARSVMRSTELAGGRVVRRAGGHLVVDRSEPGRAGFPGNSERPVVQE